MTANAAGGIAILGGRLYWADNTQGTFSSVPLDGSGSPDFAFIRGATKPFGLAVDSLRSPPFEFGRVRRNRHRGTATLTVILPGPGRLVLSGRGIKRVSKPADRGPVKLRIRPKGKAKDKLDSTGRARVKAKVTHIPTGGAPATRSKRLKLIEL